MTKRNALCACICLLLRMCVGHTASWSCIVMCWKQQLMQATLVELECWRCPHADATKAYLYTDHALTTGTIPWGTSHTHMHSAWLFVFDKRFNHLPQVSWWNTNKWDRHYKSKAQVRWSWLMLLRLKWPACSLNLFLDICLDKTLPCPQMERQSTRQTCTALNTVQARQWSVWRWLMLLVHKPACACSCKHVNR